MKIQVVRVDGGIEIINLVGTVTAHEPGQELEYPRNQSPIHVDATGMDYFFREDGKYDGWGMAVSIPLEGMPDDPPSEVTGFIEAIEKDREYVDGEKKSD